MMIVKVEMYAENITYEGGSMGCSEKHFWSSEP